MESQSDCSSDEDEIHENTDYSDSESDVDFSQLLNQTRSVRRQHIYSSDSDSKYNTWTISQQHANHTH